jgi:L-lactate dehydrogenase complex protein LldF
MLLALRQKAAEGDLRWNATPAGLFDKSFYKTWSLLVGNRKAYDIFLRLTVWSQKIMIGKNGMIHKLPFPFNGWTQSRDVKPVTPESFIDRWKKLQAR